MITEGVTGLRVDHPDGLVDPGEYQVRLAQLAPEAWITVEKILEPGEVLPDWPVAGTTGYDAMREVNGVFVDPAGEAEATERYRRLTGDQLTSAEQVERGKRMVVDTLLVAEVDRIAALAPEVEDAAAAVAEVAVAFAVYRSYLPDGVADLDKALVLAEQRRPELAAAFAGLSPRLHDASDELARRFQQLSGATMAKGTEDTAFYRYARFIALNEVGADAGEFGIGLDDFHALQHGTPGAAATVDDVAVHPRHQARRGRPGPAGGAGGGRPGVGTLRRRLPGAIRHPQPALRLLPRPDAGRHRSGRGPGPPARVRGEGDAGSQPGDRLDLGRRSVREHRPGRDRPRVRRRRAPGCLAAGARAGRAARLVECSRPEAGPAHDAGCTGRLPGHRALGGLAGRPRQPSAGRLQSAAGAARVVDDWLPRSTARGRRSSG